MIPEQAEIVTTAVENILDAFGVEWRKSRQMRDTPSRVARMYAEFFRNVWKDESELDKLITKFPNDENYDEMVFLGPINVKSLCSHHLLPFFGSAYVAYIPGKEVIGISKLVRIVRWFAERPQVQEDLTCQIAEYLGKQLTPKGVAVYISATHTCMTSRGVRESEDVRMKTSKLSGVFFEKDAARSEFFAMVNQRGRK